MLSKEDIEAFAETNEQKEFWGLNKMKYFTRKMIAHKDLNSNGTLFGGRVLDWIWEPGTPVAGLVDRTPGHGWAR